MMRIARSLALCSAFASAVLATTLPAAALDGPAFAARAADAATALQAYSDSALRAGRRPDFAAAPATDLLRVMFDADGLAALPGPRGDDLAWMPDWVEASNRGYKQMIMVGVAPGQQPDDATLARNLHDYEDQIVVGLNFQLRAMARELDAAAIFLAGLPKSQLTRIRLEGFRGFRTSASAFLQTAMCTARAMTPAHARMLVTAVTDTQASWTKGLSAEERRAAVVELEQMRKDSGDNDVTAAATRVLTAFAAAK
jgi:hypothetical protein